MYNNDMEKEEIEEKIIAFAKKAHAGQLRKFGDDKGKSYFDTHVTRVHFRVVEMGGSYDQRNAALLHDVKEDQAHAWDEVKLLEMGVSRHTLEIVDALTKRDEEGYFKFILRVMQNKDAILVKMADIEDNMMSLDRGSLLDKYLLAHHLLKTQLVMVGGHFDTH